MTYTTTNCWHSWKCSDTGDITCIKLHTKVKVHMDHANLLFWKNPGDHKRRVAHWHTELMEYNFKLMHILGKKNGHADTLSRCPDYDQGDNDNKNLMVLPPKFFSKAYYRLIKEGPKEDKKEERPDLVKNKNKTKKKAIKFSIRMMGSEKANPNNGK